MPQSFHVVRCYKCETFQVQIVKKVKKWDCKLCGSSQSLIQKFGEGTGTECRMHVQKLNKMRISSDNIDLQSCSTSVACDGNDAINSFSNPSNINHNKLVILPVNESKWSEFIEEPEISPSLDTNNWSPPSTDKVEYVLEIPKSGRKTKVKSSRIKNKSMNSLCKISDPGSSNCQYPEEDIIHSDDTNFSISYPTHSMINDKNVRNKKSHVLENNLCKINSPASSEWTKFLESDSVEFHERNTNNCNFVNATKTCFDLNSTKFTDPETSVTFENKFINLYCDSKNGSNISSINKENVKYTEAKNSVNDILKTSVFDTSKEVDFDDIFNF